MFINPHMKRFECMVINEGRPSAFPFIIKPSANFNLFKYCTVRSRIMNRLTRVVLFRYYHYYETTSQ